MEEPADFLKRYENATNTHNFENVRPLVAPNATYFFSDETLNRIDEIGDAFERTWNRIQNESYLISNVEWVSVETKSAVCTYQFNWSGLVNGVEKSGEGRGTNVLVKTDVGWQMAHEHLSVTVAS